MVSLTTNLLAVNTARNLQDSYSRLATSVERLSSGLRVNSADDDAAGLAIRELMRADIAALQQGTRNANDAISLLQVADGALGIIDEKLIRMKELAEQAATGTYDSTQRLMIDNEFKAMAEEIERIANATDFNGIKLLDGSRQGEHDGSGLEAVGKFKIHFGTGNDSAEDYYYVDIGDCTLTGLGLRGDPFKYAPRMRGAWWNDERTVIDRANMTITMEIPRELAGEPTSMYRVRGLPGLDYYRLPAGLTDVTITSNGIQGTTPYHKSHVSLFTKDGLQLTGPPVPRTFGEEWEFMADAAGNTDKALSGMWWNFAPRYSVEEALIGDGVFTESPSAHINVDNIVSHSGESVTVGALTVDMVAGLSESGSHAGDPHGPLAQEVIRLNEVTDDLVFLIGGHGNKEDCCNGYTLRIEGHITEAFLNTIDAEEKGPFIEEGFGDAILSIRTQDEAQTALTRLDDAIRIKDGVRAHLGALQNRLENTVTNLTVQAENLQAAEARISDADVGIEMTLLVRNQILTQAGVAMLSQANSLPQMMAGLLTG